LTLSRRYAILCVCIHALFVSSFARSQNQADETPDPIQVISGAINALGVASAYASVKDIMTAGTCTREATLRSQSQDGSAQFKWTVAGTEYRYESSSGSSHSVLASGHGHPAGSSSALPSPRKLSIIGGQLRLPYHLPGLLLYRESRDSNYSIRYMGTKALPEGTASWVRISQNVNGRPITSSIQDWFIGADGLPLGVDHYIAGEASIKYLLPIQTRFSDFRPIQNLLLPTTITSKVAGRSPVTCTVTESTFNVSPNDATFDLVSGGQQ